MSLGFQAAGFGVTAAIEKDAWAAETLQAHHPDTAVLQGDITQISDDELRQVCSGADVIVGGPPCQGFSVANRRAGDPNDPRNSLFMDFIRAVSIVRPTVILLENVPGLLKRHAKCGRPVIDIIMSELTALGYTVNFNVLEAVSFGVPQLRPRLFVIGSCRGSAPPFPQPTHGPAGASASDFFAASLLPYVTVWEAISDLPQIDAKEGAEQVEHVSSACNEYQVLMRAGSNCTYNHVAMNHTSRLVERFSHVSWGQSGMNAPKEHAARKRGDYSQISGKDYSQNNRRMHPDLPCHTIPASFYANFIHPYRHRNFTPREGARLQSFPDWYRFSGKPTVVSNKLLAREGRTEELHLCQYNQIGNAVPPLLAYHLANNIKKYLDEAKTR